MRHVLLAACLLLTALAVDEAFLRTWLGLPFLPPMALRLMWVARLGLAVLALGLVWRRPQRLAALQRALAALLVIATAAVGYQTLERRSLQRLAAAMAKVDRSEATILKLGPSLERLRRGLLDLALPDSSSLELFAARLQATRLGTAPSQGKDHAGLYLEYAWPIDPPREVERAELRPWAHWLERVAYFEHVELGVRRGAFATGRADHFDTDLTLKGTARGHDGRVHGFIADLSVLFRLGPDPQEQHPSIERFVTTRFVTQEAAQPMYREVLSEVLSGSDLRAARRSIHEGQVRALLEQKAEFEAPHSEFSVISEDYHPGLAVADVDGDGRQDLYVMARWGRNQLLHIEGDGSFRNVAPELGLDVLDHSAAAIFAEFDNDGDADVFVGRTLARSLYLENDGGRFVDRSARVNEPLPGLVSGLSVVDYDRDGLLDVYVATYWARKARPVPADRCPEFAQRWGQYFAKTRDALEMCTRLAGEDYHPTQSRYGPPNLLLRNAGGGRFEVVRDAGHPVLALYRNSFQCAFADYDDDSDPDVYCANDFAPNHMLRNEGGGRFKDITDSSGTADSGIFSMSVAFGDYDGDGRQDLYVANMSSKAGARIMAQIPGLDASFPEMARGNSLYRNRADGFSRVSGAGTSLAVERAGWAWGAQFLDINNDGDLDIYSPAGYYTAPRPYALPVDT